MIPTNQASISVGCFDSLVRIEEQLYCLSQALSHGDRQMYDHYEKLAGVAHQIWGELSNIIDQERHDKKVLEEELKKFEQGFAYEPRKNSPCC